ncbi:MAG: hypothetical protein EOO16_11985 [Chitinophagaceae bacterium]|nr:MAG: hypothetical protein EOO16_11985 [Chitinophagaceae bacterium]
MKAASWRLFLCGSCTGNEKSRHCRTIDCKLIHILRALRGGFIAPDLLKHQKISSMKKIALFSFGMLSVAAANAQLNKGRIFLGGSISSNQTKNTTVNTPADVVTKQQSTTIDPAVGFFIKDNLVVGVNVGFTQSKKTNSVVGTTQTKESIIAPGIFARQYFPLGGNFYFYGHAGLQYQGGTEETYTNTATLGKEKSNGVNLSVYPGVAYAIRRNFLLEVSLRNLFTAGFSSSKSEDNTGKVVAKSNNFNVGINGGGGVPLTVGFNILLGK